MVAFTENNYSQYIQVNDLKRLKFISTNLKIFAPHGKDILDVGCGNGNISIHLGHLGYKVVGIDVSKTAIDKAIANNNLPNVNFEVRSAESLVSDGKKYDAVICSEVLEHLIEPSILLNAIYGMLKDKGILIVTVPNGFGPRELFMTKPMQWMKKKNNLAWKITNTAKNFMGYKGNTIQSDAEDLTHIHFFSIKSLKNLASQNHFSIIKIGKSNFIEDVFPFSLITKKIKVLQALDCKVADVLPLLFTGGFNTVWIKKSLS